MSKRAIHKQGQRYSDGPIFYWLPLCNVYYCWVDVHQVRAWQGVTCRRCLRIKAARERESAPWGV